MKLKSKHIGLGMLGIFLLIGFSTQLFSNLWGILIGHTIPKQSSIFTFEVKVMNQGSGDYWLYGEDQKYYYTALEASHTEPYALVSKENAKSIHNFDKTNYKTWRNPKIPCGDLLSTFAKKPQELEFVKCERLKNNQTKVRVTYRVKGNLSKEVETFLTENYEMGELKWVCCGWETSGGYGRFEHPELTKIDPYLFASIDMYASGEITDKNEPREVRLELDRNKIEYFTVTVELSII